MAQQLFLNNFDTSFIAAVKDTPVTGAPATELDYGILRISDGAAGTLLNPTGGDYYLLTAFKRSGTAETNIEIMKVTAVDNSVPGECRITVLRGQEDTPTRAYVGSDYLSLRWTKGAAQTMVQTTDTRLTDPRTPTGGAGGVLSGSYPNPGFAVDMATQAELDAHAGTGGSTHAAATASVAGFMSAEDKTKLNGVAPGATANTGDVTLTDTQTLTNKTITGGKETRVAMAANNIDLTAGNFFTKTIAGTTTFTVSGTAASGSSSTFILDLTDGGSASVTWFSGVKWAGGTAPTLTASGRDVLGFFTHDNGTIWTGLVLAKDVK